MNWECDECNHVHRKNPRSCSNCGHTVLSPVPASPDDSEGMSRRTKVILAVIVLAVAIGGVAYIAMMPAEEEPAEAMNQVQVEYHIHQQVNEERAAQGLEPLEFDTELRGIARDYSEQMATERFFGHYDANGRSFQDRYEAAGYNCSIPLNETHVLQGGENLAQTHYNTPVNTTHGEQTEYKTLDDLAAGVVDGWMNSPEHRANLLTPEWENEGIGVYVTTNDSVYVTQNFC